MVGKMSIFWGVALVVGLLAVMVPETMQLHVDHPLYDVVQKVNNKAQATGVPILGLVLTSSDDEKHLLSSGYFVTDSSIPYITIAGRQFNIGFFNGVVAVYVLAGDPLAAIGVTVQIMLDTFRIGAIISVGGAGSLDKEVAVGDVAVLFSSAYTGVWYWKEWESSSLSKTPNATLEFGEYNYPEAGDNKLASVKLQSVTRYTPTSSSKTTFWFSIPLLFQKLANQLKDVELKQCEEGVCDFIPKVVIGVKGATSDIYLRNKAYGKFLHQNLGVSVVDKQSAAVGSTAYANGVPYALFRAATNKPGKISDNILVDLATINSFKVAAAFARIISKPIPTINYFGA